MSPRYQLAVLFGQVCHVAPAGVGRLVVRMGDAPAEPSFAAGRSSMRRERVAQSLGAIPVSVWPA